MQVDLLFGDKKTFDAFLKKGGVDTKPLSGVSLWGLECRQSVAVPKGEAWLVSKDRKIIERFNIS